MPSTTSVAQVRALVPGAAPLTDPQLQEVIDREEAWLARRIGALEGSRTATFVVTSQGAALPLRLPRPASSVTVVDNGTALASSAYRLDDPWTLSRVSTTSWAPASWTGPVVATWDPIDKLEVVKATIELVRLTLAETGHDSETVGPYSYNRGDVARRRRAILGALRPKATIGSVLFATGYNPPVWIGSRPS